MTIKKYLEPFVPAQPRLIEMGMTFARNKAATLHLDLSADPPQRLEEDVRTSMACGIRGLFFTLAKGITHLGMAVNITPNNPEMQEVFAQGLFTRLPVEPQHQPEALPLLMEEFRRLADVPGLQLPYGSQLQKSPDGVIMLPGKKPPAPVTARSACTAKLEK